MLNSGWKSVLGLILIGLTTASWTAADEKQAAPSKERVQLEDLVVTATRTEKEAGSAPANVSVVTQEEIRKSGARSVDEALSGIAGAYNPRSTRGGVLDSLAGGALTLRGVPRANNTLFMVDGIVLNDAYSGSHRSTLGIATENVARIEVVKGPFSSLYGGYAVGGVVNIMMKMPEKRQFVLKTGYGSSWDRGEASDDLRTFYFSGGDKIVDKFSFLVGYGCRDANGYPTHLNVQSTAPPAGIDGWTPTADYKGADRYLIGDRGDKTWWDDNLFLKAGWDLTENTRLRLSFTNARFEYDYDEPHTYLRDAAGNPVWSYGSVREASFLYLNGRSRNEEQIYGLTFDTEISNVKIKTALGYVDQPEYYYITPSSISATRAGGPGTVTHTPSSTYNADLQLTVPLGDRHIFTFGGAFKHGEAQTCKRNLTNWHDEDSKTDMTFEARGEDKIWAFFAQDEIKLFDTLTAYLGFRQDWWETYDGYTNSVGDPGYPQDYSSRDASAFSPKAALVYQPFEATTLRASVGRSFRPPTVYELYSIWIYRGVTTMADPNLEPEKTISWDAGIEQRLWRGAKVGITYFENRMEDLIYNQTVSDTLIQRTNVGEAESKGVELEIEQRLGEAVRLFANYTYTDSKVTENAADPDVVGKQLVQVPERMFNFGGDFSSGPWTVSASGHYMSKRYRYDDNSDTQDDVYTSYDPYFVADARVGYKVTTFAEVSLSVNNLFDEDYYSYYPAPGRSWFAELTLTF
jgi:iron complex outermembrane receptor protein